MPPRLLYALPHDFRRHDCRSALELADMPAPQKPLRFTDSCVQSPSGSATSSGRLKLPPAPVTGTRRSPLGHLQVDHLRRPRFMQVDDETPPLTVIAPDSRSLSKLD